MACPGCGSTQVVKLKPFWKELTAGTPAHAELAPPPAAEPQYLYAAAVAGLGVAVTATGALLGLVALAGGIGWGAVMRGNDAAAQAARDRWARLLYCRECEDRFPPEKST